MSEVDRSILTQAAEAIQHGQFGQALELAEQFLISEPTSCDALVIKGVALSQLTRNVEATQAFQAAIASDPTSAKAFYNFAAHLYQTGERGQALTYAQQALQRDPDHAASRELEQRITAEMTSQAPPPAQGMPYQSGPQQYSEYMRPGSYPGGPVSGGIPWVTKLGSSWLLIGWLIIALWLIYFVFSIIFALPMIQEVTKAMQSQNGQAQIQEIAAKNSKPGFQALGYLFMVSGIGWTITDLIHRRGNFLWLVPMILCSCCGFGWMIMPLYIAAGRNNQRNA